MAVDGTDLGADAAADAGHRFDAGLALPCLGVLFVGQHHGGAAALDALAAGDALVGIHHTGGLGAAGDEHAVPARDQDGYAVVGGAFFKAPAYFLHVERIGGDDLSTPQARHSPAMSTGSMVPLESVLERPGLS